MKINHNIPALRTLNALSHANKKTADTMERLSSGLRINSASDDAAGMAIANKMDAQIKGLQQANRNTMDGISMIQTAEGALNETHAILQRTRELAVQAANDTNSDEDRAAIQEEINQLLEEIDRIAEQTEFNTKKLLNEDDNEVKLQIGANQGQTISITLTNMGKDKLFKINGTDFDEDIDVIEKPEEAITRIDDAINMVSQQRAHLGATQNRLEHTVSNLGVSEENLTSSLSRIQDADMAQEMATFTQQNVLSQAATAMLAQANQRPQQVLQLLQR